MKKIVYYLLLLLLTACYEEDVDVEQEAKRIGKFFCNCMYTELAKRDYRHARVLCESKSKIKFKWYRKYDADLSLPDTSHIISRERHTVIQISSEVMIYLREHCCKETKSGPCQERKD